MNKPTNTEMSQRILEVYTLLVNGHSNTDICRYAKEKWGLVNSRSVDRYIKKAYEIVYASNNQTMEELRKETSLRMDDIYKKAMEKEHFRVCIEAMKLKAKINGLEVLSVKIADTTPADKSLIEGLLAQGENDRS